MLMEIEVLNGSYACSTLILGEFFDCQHPSIKNLKMAVDNFDSFATSPYGGGHKTKDHSFIVASTRNDQKDILTILETLGFSRHGPTYNNKNGTTVCFWVLDVPTFLENLDKEVNK